MKPILLFSDKKTLTQWSFILLIILMGTGCNTTSSQETISQIPPQESAEPFDTGTVDVLQMPTRQNMAQGNIKLIWSKGGPFIF